MNKEKKRLVSAFAAISVSLFIIVGVIYFLSTVSSTFADYINATLSQDFRRAMASVGGLFSFSLFQAIVIALPLILFIIVYLAIKAFTHGNIVRYIINVCAVFLLVYSGHLLALGVGYHTTDISDKMQLEDSKVDEESLVQVLEILIDDINALAADMPRNGQGIFDPDCTNAEISERICESFNQFSEKYSVCGSFDSSFKTVGVANFMSYLGLTGIYTYYTGEANVNEDYPAYVRIFTAAHEMAHQRGVLRENEANFVAYIVTSSSSDPYLQYSGALDMYGYFASALYKTNKERYYSVAENLSDYAWADVAASNAVSRKYGDTFISQISDMINNLYLKSNGTEGVITYSKVVQLVISYYK